VNDVAVVGAGMAPFRSPSVEKALRELAQMAVTEACVSGLCDMCLYQAGLCDMASQRWKDSDPSTRSGK
jgi:acetyl-CoA acetyltransferase